MSKTIIYFADGTWNGNGESLDQPNEESFSKDTNVYKLFLWLEGEAMMTEHHGPGLKSWMKVFPQPRVSSASQVAMYCHGVGDNRWIPSERVLGGALGAGLTTRLRLGYTFISQYYKSGDKIVIVGFSRGAYAARALADLIASEGLLSKELANDGNKWLSWSAAAWLRYRGSQVPSTHPDLLARIQLLSARLHRNLLKGKELKDSDFVPVDSLAAVVVWDTVGAVGVPVVTGKDRKDEFNFDSEDLHPKIGFALHAVSLDEQRIDFEPMLWKPSPRLIQEVFAGGHADVGGGYPEHELSDVPFVWAKDKLNAQVPLLLRERIDFAVNPNPLGTGHRAWTKFPARLRRHKPRVFPAGYLNVNEAVRQRMEAPKVEAEPRVMEKYAPANVPK
jgi:uncharacterized protein (DUF2235 family)